MRYRRASASASLRRPELGVAVSGVRDDFWADSSAKQLTPARLGQILREAEDGHIERQCEVFDKIEEDPHLAAVYAKRKRAATNKELQLEPSDDTAMAQRAVDLCEEAKAQMKGWRESLYHLHDAIGRAFSVCQTIWVRRGARYLPEQLQWWKQREFLLDTSSHDVDAIRVRTDQDQSQGEILMPGQWVVHRYKARSGTLAEAPLLRGLAWAWLFKHSSWRDWVIFSEAYGMPRRLAYYPRGASDDEKRAAWAAARILGRDAAAALPEGAKLEFLKAETGSSQLPFPDLIKLSDSYISKLILGQTLTTEVGDNGGNRALGQVHREVELDLLEADCVALAETLRDQLFAPLVQYNLGDDAPVPLVRFSIEEDEDLLQRAKRDRELYEMGVEFSLKQLREKYGLDAPENDEDRLVKSVATSGASVTAASEFANLLDLAEQKKKSMDWVLSTRSSTGEPNGR